MKDPKTLPKCSILYSPSILNVFNKNFFFKLAYLENNKIYHLFRTHFTPILQWKIPWLEMHPTREYQWLSNHRTNLGSPGPWRKTGDQSGLRTMNRIEHVPAAPSLASTTLKPRLLFYIFRPLLISSCFLGFLNPRQNTTHYNTRACYAFLLFHSDGLLLQE